jgi:hypothetical protein
MGRDFPFEMALKLTDWMGMGCKGKKEKEMKEQVAWVLME